MGGRGGSSGKAGGGGQAQLSEKQMLKIENDSQFEYAKFYGYTRGAKSVEYTDSEGKVRKAETGRQTGGVYRTSFSQKVADYARMSTSELETALQKQQNISDTNYQGFTRLAASRSGSLVNSFANADVEIAAIKQVLRRRRKK